MKPLLCVVFFALSSLWQSLFLLKFCLQLGFNTLNFQFQNVPLKKKGKSDKKQLPARARDTLLSGNDNTRRKTCDDDDDDDSEDSDPLVVVVVFIFFAEEE